MKIQRKAIMTNILNYFNNHTGTFHGYDLFKYVTANNMYKNMYMDTMLRYMRQLRADGKINYNQIGMKADSLYEIVKYDKSHV